MDNPLNILIHDECQLVDWGESRSLGPWVKLKLSDIAELEALRGLDTATATRSGHILNLTLSEGDILTADSQRNQEGKLQTADKQAETGSQRNQEGKKKSKGEFGSQAKSLRLSSFFLRPDVWASVGSDAEYQDWVRTQPCVICGSADLIADTGELKCESAHVRRAGESGTGHKAGYATVPMCHEHHQVQHNQGEVAVWLETLEEMPIEAIDKSWPTTEAKQLQMAKDWFDKQRIEHVQAWAWHTLKKELGFDSWAQVPPVHLYEWAIHNHIPEKMLPVEYRE